jgi:hypothetical protein
MLQHSQDLSFSFHSYITYVLKANDQNHPEISYEIRSIMINLAFQYS